MMEQDIERILIPSDRIAHRVRELADRITADHQSLDGGITLVPILTGAMIFAADLMRQLGLRLRIGLLTVSSYPGTSLRTQGVRILAEQVGDLHGRHVVLIDDILDSGGTIKAVRSALENLGPAQVKTCVLLRKQRPEAMGTPVDYVGFDIPDEFVVGYGLDYDDDYRNLPDIVTLRKSVTAGPPECHDRRTQ